MLQNLYLEMITTCFNPPANLIISQDTLVVVSQSLDQLIHVLVFFSCDPCWLLVLHEFESLDLAVESAGGKSIEFSSMSEARQ